MFQTVLQHIIISLLPKFTGIHFNFIKYIPKLTEWDKLYIDFWVVKSLDIKMVSFFLIKNKNLSIFSNDSWIFIGWT